MYTALHVGCASFPVFTGMTLCSQLPLPGVRQLCLGLLGYGFGICFLRNFFSYGGHFDFYGDDGFHPIREGER